ncbi:MAG: esterase [Ectothiorhodospiraceae bacterium]|nr:esterase [Ectothiorhodospiraceae bacterium]
MRAYTQSWHSPHTGRQMEFRHFGDRGAPVLVFPTTSGDHNEFADRGMIHILADKIERGHIQVLCINSLHWEGWYNDGCEPHRKVEIAVAFEDYLVHEFFPYLRHATGMDSVIAFGISFGAYQAANFALKHPDLVHRLLAVYGSFDIKGLLHGHYDELCYFNNPVDYLPNMNDPWFLERYRQMDITLITSDSDLCLQRNMDFSHLLNTKGVEHNFYRWSADFPHEWPSWQHIVPHYL